MEGTTVGTKLSSSPLKVILFLFPFSDIIIEVFPMSSCIITSRLVHNSGYLQKTATSQFTCMKLCDLGDCAL